MAPNDKVSATPAGTVPEGERKFEDACEVIAGELRVQLKRRLKGAPLDGGQIVFGVRRLQDLWKGRERRLAAALALLCWEQGLSFDPGDLERELAWQLARPGRTDRQVTRLVSKTMLILGHFERVATGNLDIALAAGGGFEELARHSAPDDLVRSAIRHAKVPVTSRTSPGHLAQLRKAKPNPKHRARRQ